MLVVHFTQKKYIWAYTLNVNKLEYVTWEPSVTIVLSLLFIEFSRHCVLSGETQRRLLAFFCLVTRARKRKY